MDIASVIIWKLGNVDFVIRGGVIEWSEETHPEPTGSDIALWTDEMMAAHQQESANQTARQFLTDTDWKIIRHIRQKALEIETSLTEEEYIALETERQQKAESIT
jgi:hypothetical protein